MPLKPPVIPDRVKRAIDRLDAFLMPGDPSPRGPGTQGTWQTVFTLTLKDLAKKKFNPSSKHWRYLINNESAQALYATVSDNKMTGLSRGPEVAVALQAARELRTLPEAAKGEWEWSVLTIPGLLTESFWLKRGRVGWVVPFFTSQSLRCGHPYRLKEFVEIMGPLAKTQNDSIKTLEDKRNEKAKNREARTKTGRRRAQEQLNEAHKRQVITEARRIMAEERQQKKREKAVSAQQEVLKSAINVR